MRFHKVLANAANYAFSFRANAIWRTVAAKTHQLRRMLSPAPLLPVALLPVSFAFGASVEAKLQLIDKQLLEEADKLFDEHKLQELLTLLKSIGSWYSNGDVLWRVARCEYHLYKTDPNAKDAREKLENALLLVQKSLELNDNCGPAHKWAAILLDAVSSLEGTKARIAQLLNVRQHMERAIELTPNDPTSYYLLGNWHFSCHQVSWIERNIARVLFGALPDADLEVALKMFSKAESLEPGFYSQNELLLAKTLITLNRDIDKARDHLLNVVKKYENSKNWDDAEAFKEAKTLLQKMGVKM
ncbi:hypothetical protein B4U79_11525 [Dinothrombium tinctorium]|uniref:Regulator of microtubule dynamics protein 1 n=1 Tax=Dinothrombium tinctorium TaxID=1965070 RepID=A0A443R0A6_9ACAR|nr:hypothetical protein B4U79_11525 [Dinothrombium tinctorium]